MSKAPMPLNWAEYLADTQHLCAEQHGMYLLLIGHYWQTGGLPDSEMQLVLVCRCTDLTRFRQNWAIVQKFFSRVGGRWVHNRIELDLKKINAIKEKRSAASMERWSKCDTLTSNSGMQVDMQEGMHGEGSPSSSNKELLESLKTKSKSKTTTSRPPACTFDWAKQDWVNTEPLLAVWTSAYPDIDVPAELRRARAWVVANPGRAKNNWPRFLTNWFARNSARSKPEPAPGADPFAGMST